MNILKKLLINQKRWPKKLFLYDRLHEILGALPRVNRCLDIGSGRRSLYKNKF